MPTPSFVEHVAIRVKDLQWHIDFFADVFGMGVRQRSEPGAALEQVWLHGGVQLVACKNFGADPNGQLGHLGIMTDDLEGALKKVYEKEVTELAQGRNWFSLSEGICIEALQAPKV